jgi:hypothetical protein
VEKEGAGVGPEVLFTWLEPVDRHVFGETIYSVDAGVFLDLLVYPEHRGWVTALSPSLPGELYVGLGLLGTMGGLMVYGWAVGWASRWQEAKQRAPVLFAAYPFVTYMLAKMIVDGTLQLFRPVVVSSVIIVFWLVGPNTVRGAGRGDA